MLVLTRKQAENVVIDDVITVKILNVKGRTVRLGIEAPANVRIRRGELRQHRRPPLAVENRPAATPAQVTPVQATEVANDGEAERVEFILAFNEQPTQI